METEKYIRKRDFEVLGVIGICATTKQRFIDEVFSLPKSNLSSTVNLVGIPAVVSARENPEIAKLYNEATMSIIDGQMLVGMGRRRKFECERCAGPDFLDMLFEQGIEKGITHYFYGGKNEDVLNRLIANLRSKHKGVKIIGSYSPPFRKLTDEEEQYVCDEINSLAPDFVWVGIGAPKQELWMREHHKKINNVTMVGIGATFDFLAGTLDKAPQWISNIGLEWLFRLCKEPKRLWKRYIFSGVKYIYYTIEYKVKTLIKGNC